MQIVKSWVAFTEAIRVNPAASHLRQHFKRLCEFADQPLDSLCTFIIVEPGDRLVALQSQLRRPLHPPPWEYVDCAGGWFELVLVTGDNGFGHVVLVPHEAAIDPEILEYCRTLTT